MRAGLDPTGMQCCKTGAHLTPNIATIPVRVSLHRCPAPSLHCSYVGLTRAKNFCVVFDRNGQQRAPLYHFLRRLGLGSHVSSVLGGGLAGAVRGSLSNNPLEWSKRAANLVEMKLFKLAAQCYGSAGDVLRAAAYGAMDILHVSPR